MSAGCKQETNANLVKQAHALAGSEVCPTGTKAQPWRDQNQNLLLYFRGKAAAGSDSFEVMRSATSGLQRTLSFFLARRAQIKFKTVQASPSLVPPSPSVRGKVSSVFLTASSCSGLRLCGGLLPVPAVPFAFLLTHSLPFLHCDDGRYTP